MTISPPAPRRSPWQVAWRGAVSAAVGVGIWATQAALPTGTDDLLRVWFWSADPVIGLGAIAASLLWSRRHPLTMVLVAAVAALVSFVAIGATLLALGSLATRRSVSEIAVAVPVALVGLRLAGLIYPDGVVGTNWWLQLLILGLLIGVVVAVGIAVGQRRALVDGLRERAESAEREQEARAEAARAEERTRIAHDMHDVVAHRISLVALHAAALRYREDLPTEQRRETLSTIETNARLALDELRDVLGALRRPADQTVEPPQPRLDAIRGLVEEGRAAGMGIELFEDVVGEPPTVATQAAHRIVREGLTNARKHAPGGSVHVSLGGEPGDGLAVRVTNTAGTSEPLGLTGSGLGLIGLRERTERTGGRMTTQATADGGFEISAWLPWAK